MSISGSITDPGWEDPLSATIDFGDGAGPQALAAPARWRSTCVPTASICYDIVHVYGDDGTFKVKVCGADDDVSGICQDDGGDGPQRRSERDDRRGRRHRPSTARR